LLCVNKYPPCYVTLLITVQLACNNGEVVNPFHPQLNRNSPTPFNTAPPGSFSSQTECGAVCVYIYKLNNYSKFISYYVFELN
jgi:hypothetical protein